MWLFIIELIILVAGIGLIMHAKLHFARRQKYEPDNKWSDYENKVRYLGYGLCILDVLMALFIKV